MAFRGPRLDLHYAKRNDGGTAVVIIDGDVQETVSFTSRRRALVFGSTREYRDLGRGEHTIRIVVNAPQRKKRFAFVDSFTIAGPAR